MESIEGRRGWIKLQRYFEVGNGSQRPQVGGHSSSLQNSAGDSICQGAEVRAGWGRVRMETAGASTLGNTGSIPAFFCHLCTGFLLPIRRQETYNS